VKSRNSVRGNLSGLQGYKLIDEYVSLPSDVLPLSSFPSFSVNIFRSLPALLTKETIRTSSRVCALLFLPSLVVSSIGSTLTPSILLDSWQLVVAAVFTISISFALAGVLGRVFLSAQDRRGLLPVQLAIAFPNSVTFPLLLVDALCKQDAINGYGTY